MTFTATSLRSTVAIRLAVDNGNDPRSPSKLTISRISPTGRVLLEVTAPGRARTVDDTVGIVYGTRYDYQAVYEYTTSPTLVSQSVSEVYNPTPNAPALTPTAAVLDRGVIQRFSWTFSDPGDSQSAADFRYRLVGAATWTVLYTQRTVSYADITAGFFAAGDYEWQVRTYDSLGEPGPYSSSGFFTAADAPVGPTFTDPVSGATIPTASYLAAWSVPNQDAYQLRSVADTAGSPDTSVVYFDTGTVESETVRSRSVDFPVNERIEHLQLRVRENSLWTAWATSRVTVSYTPPPVPLVVLVESDLTGSIDVTISAGAPTGAAGEPATTAFDLEVEALGGRDVHRPVGSARRIGKDLPGGVFADHAAASGVPYRYRATAIGENGTRSTGAWVEFEVARYSESEFDQAVYA